MTDNEVKESPPDKLKKCKSCGAEVPMTEKGLCGVCVARKHGE